jgi:hypothetical protein
MAELHQLGVSIFPRLVYLQSSIVLPTDRYWHRRKTMAISPKSVAAPAQSRVEMMDPSLQVFPYRGAISKQLKKLYMTVEKDPETHPRR